MINKTIQTIPVKIGPHRMNLHFPVVGLKAGQRLEIMAHLPNGDTRKVVEYGEYPEGTKFTSASIEFLLFERDVLTRSWFYCWSKRRKARVKEIDRIIIERCSTGTEDYER